MPSEKILAAKQQRVEDLVHSITEKEESRIRSVDERNEAFEKATKQRVDNLI